MELARYRVNVGSANLTELYRWESEIANNLKAVIEANADKNLAEININQLLNLPAEESFSIRITSYNVCYTKLLRNTIPYIKRFLRSSADILLALTSF